MPKRKKRCYNNEEPNLLKEFNKFEKTLLLDDTLNGIQLSSFMIFLKSKLSFDIEKKLLFFYTKDSNECFLLVKDKIPIEGTYSFGVCVVPADVLDCLAEPRVFNLSWSYHKPSNSLYIKVLINEKAIFKVEYAAQLFSNCFQCDVKRVVKYFYNYRFKEPEIETFDLNTPTDIPSKWLGINYNPEKKVIITVKDLIPNLSPYQCQAVKFMLDRERNSETADDLYTKIKLANDTTIYFHNYCGIFVREKLKPLPRGGILADERSMGKTIDIIACILLNPRKVGSNELYVPSSCSEISNSEEFRNPSKLFECICRCNESKTKKSVTCLKCKLTLHPECVLHNSSVNSTEYVCPYCLVNCPEYAVRSPTTLIVAPLSIIDQWEDEINQHVSKNSLKILRYHGLSCHKFMHPASIAQNDVVLIAYETLKAELKSTKECYGEDQYKLRHAKKFRSLPSPLLAIEWWRVCLDECQMFENVTTKMSQIVLQLRSINKWCISGTPLLQSYQDFFGYFKFLGYDPYCVRHWFNEILWNPFQKGKKENFFSALRKILWCTMKKDVISQISNPSQETIIHELEFSPLEKLYYDCVKEKQKKIAHEILNAYKAVEEEGKLVDKTEAAKILKPLTKLHKACNFIIDNKDRIVTLEKLYDKMLEIKLGECAELHRKIISSLNGAAGLISLIGNSQLAYVYYRRVFQFINENKKNIQTDTVQEIHAYYNYCLKMESESLPAQDLKICQYNLNERIMRYIRKFIHGMTIADKNCKAETAKVDNLAISYAVVEYIEHISWWMEILNSVDEKSQGIFIGRLKMSLKNAEGNSCVPQYASISYKLRKISALKHSLLKVYKDLREARCKLLNSMISLNNLRADDVRYAAMCHKMPRKQRCYCVVCEVGSDLKNYEKKLFHFTEQSDSSDEFSDDEDNSSNSLRKRKYEIQKTELRADSELEVSLKFFISYSRSMPALSKYTEQGENEIKLFQVLKKEFHALHNMWLETLNYISALNEIERAKISTRFRMPGEQRDPSVSYIVEPDEVENMYATYLFDACVQQNKFEETLRYISYLKHSKNIGAGNKKECPICLDESVSAMYALQCGHLVCFFCFDKIKDLLKCPFCKIEFKIEDVYHAYKSDEYDLKGQFSTKLTAVMKCILEIYRKYTTAKIIVFSKWSKVLKNIRYGLKENEMSSIYITEKNFCYENVQKFKKSLNTTVLLLPVDLDIKGLYLADATHLLFVEPTIIKEEFLKAVERVHRIGQTKKTFVHVFYVKDTIDEKIYILQEQNDGLSSKISKDNLINYMNNSLMSED